MSKVVVENEVLIAAVEKTKICFENAFCMVICPRNEGEDFNRATILTSSSNATASACFCTKVRDLKKPIQLCLGITFYNAVKALSGMKENYVLDIQKNNILVKSGKACIPVEFFTEESKLKRMQITTPNDEEDCLILKFFTKDLKDGFRYGAYVADAEEKGNQSGANVFADAFFLRPVMNGEQAAVRLYSCAEKNFICGCTVPIAEVGSLDLVKKAIEAGRSISASRKLVNEIIGNVSNETIDVYIFKTQIAINCGTEMYSLTLKSGVAPKQLEEYIFENEAREFRFTVNAKQLISMISIAKTNAKTSEDEFGVKLKMKQDLLTVTSYNGHNVSSTNINEVEGAAYVCVNGVNLALGINHCYSENASIYGTDGKSLIYIQGDNKNAITAICPVAFSDSEEENNE